MVIKFAFTLLGVLTFLYFFWRKLNEDYTANQIFTAGFFCLFGITIFSSISLFYLPQYTFWLSFTGSMLGLIVAVNKYKFRLFDSLEAWIFANLGVIFWFYLYGSIEKFTLFEAYAALGTAFLCFLFLFLDKHYRRFRWYRTGRVGFAGFFVMGLFFLVRTVVALLFPGMIFFVGSVDAVLSGVLAFFSFITVYNLARTPLK